MSNKELIEKLKTWADGDVREIGRELVNGTLQPDREDFSRWAELMEQAAEALSSAEAERERLRASLQELAIDWLHLNDVADSMDLASAVGFDDLEAFEGVCRRARSTLSSTDNSI